jgi:DnaJ-class molecular chaperone
MPKYCERCQGKGIITKDNLEKFCPVCEGTGLEDGYKFNLFEEKI